MHEIVTLQFGHRANYLATHFWNTQESYFTYDTTQAPSPVDHDVHFRSGVGARGEDTFTPRTLIYDLKGGFGGLRKWGGLYDQQQLDAGHTDKSSRDVWDGNMVTLTDPQIVQSDYQRGLDEEVPGPQNLTMQTVRYWSDFNRVFYHPRSIMQINDYELGSSLMPFEKWENGEELFANLDRDVDLLDRDMRVWAEECDQMQGVQIYTGGDDAWAGFATKYVEKLRDEYGKTAIWAWGIENENGKGQRAEQHLRTLNSAKTIYEMSAHASMYIPLSVPAPPLPQYTSLDRASYWQSSALLLTALETITLPSRLRPSTTKRGLLGDLEAALNVNGNQRIAELHCSILGPEHGLSQPIDSARGAHDDRIPSDIHHEMLQEDGPEVPSVRLDMDLSGCNYRSQPTSYVKHRAKGHMFGAVEEIRGINLPADDQRIDGDDVSYAKRRTRFAGLPVVERYHSALEFPLLDSFPKIFSFQPDCEKIPVHTSLSTTSTVSSRVTALQMQVKRFANLEERETLSNGLGEISEAYEDGWQSGSDIDSDD